MNEYAAIHYADITPKHISACETYAYTVKLRSNPNTRPAGNAPLGKIRIEVPYDGAEHFSTGAAEQLGSRLGFQFGASIAGQIGWLALSRPAEWEQDWQPKPGAETYPVHIPLLNSIITDPSQWIADTFKAIVCHEYAPAMPGFIPLRMEMAVFDNAQDMRQNTRLNLTSDKALNVSGISKFLSGDALQGGQLLVTLSITAFIPNSLVNGHKAASPITVTVEKFRLSWPTIAPYWQISIWKMINLETSNSAYADISWHYNPDDECVELESIPAQAGQPAPGSLLVPYQCNLQIALKFPGKVISQDELTGSLQLNINGCLLSGRQIAWLDVSGQRAKSDILEMQTTLDVNFHTVLSDLFLHRNTAAYRQWYFPGVRLNHARLDDIAAALRDIGYKISKKPEFVTLNAEQADSEMNVGFVSARRGQSDVEIWALPAPAVPTQRNREIGPGGGVSTTWETSDLILQARGNMIGPGSQLGLDMETLMMQLKNRFSAVADLR